MKKIVSINKVPYLLWGSYEKEVEFDEKNLTVKSDITEETSLKKVSFKEIFFLKYFPVIFMFLWVHAYPKSISEGIIFLISLASSIFFIYLFNYSLKSFKFLIISLTILVYFLLFNFMEFVILLEMYFMFVAEITILIIGYILFKRDSNSTFYSLKDVKREHNITLTSKGKRRFLPFVKITTGKDREINFSLGGYFMRVDNE